MPALSTGVLAHKTVDKRHITTRESRIQYTTHSGKEKMDQKAANGDVKTNGGLPNVFT